MRFSENDNDRLAHAQKRHQISCSAAGNPWPPVVPKERDQRNSLVNILLDQARKDYRQQKYESIAALELNKQSEQQTSNIDDSSASTS